MELKEKKKILGMNREEFYIFLRKYGIGVVMIFMIIILTIASPTFRTTGNVISILLQVSINGLLALGMVFVITAGGIDLSIGSMLALSSVIIGAVLDLTGNILLASMAAVAATTIFGFINGFLVAKLNMVPFVVTLATMCVIRGAAYVISGGYAQSLGNPQFRQIGAGKLFEIIPYPVIILIIFAILAFILLHMTKFGRHIYAVGGNIVAATESGINVFRVRTYSFIISGFCAGIAGVILTSRIGAAQPNIGVSYELDAIAACVVGGTSFLGGISTIPGVFMGIIILGLTYNGMNLIGISSFFQTITKGLLIIGAVMIDMFMSKRKR
jgi:ribose/xylose/arabinose/galactoside ABC-type transport system permease subunit